MTDDKKLVEDWLCKHFPYHLRVNKDIPKGAYVMMKSEILMSQGWLWVDNPPYLSFDNLMFGYTIPRDFYSGAGGSYCGYPIGPWCTAMEVHRECKA